jgi:hypothetical protein
MNDTEKNTILPKIKSQEKIDTPPNPSTYSDIVLSLNNIIPIASITLFFIYISYILVKNGLRRYSSLINRSIQPDEIKFIILKIIGTIICICSVIFIIYYFVTSPVFTYSFNITDVRTNFSLINIIYKFFFVIAILILLLLPVIVGDYDVSSDTYLNYFGSISALLIYCMFLYYIIQEKKIDGNLLYFLGIFVVVIIILLVMVATSTVSQQWFYIFASMMLFFVGLTCLLYYTKNITNDTSSNMKWVPKTLVDKLLYFLVFMPLRIMYYYPYIFIHHIIPGLYSLFFSPTIIIYTIIFICGIAMMKYILPYFKITFEYNVYLSWFIIYCIMVYTNKLVNSSTTFFSMRQGFLFLCLLLIFLAYIFFIKQSDTMPEYLKLYLSSFVFITGIIAVFMFFYMTKAEQKEFSDCDLYKNVFPTSFTNINSLNNQEKLNGIIPTLKRILLAYVAICISCYVLIYLSNKFFPMKSGVIGQITGIIIIILIFMIFISLFAKLKEEGINKNINKFKIPNSFINFLFSLLSFLGELVFYIPCKIHDFISSIGSANKTINKTTIFFIIIDIIFILIYVYGSYIRKFIYINGVFPDIWELMGFSDNTTEQFIPIIDNILSTLDKKKTDIDKKISKINKKISNIDIKYPISLKEYDMSVSNFIAKSTDKSMNNTEDTIYNYSISFWFNIDTNSPSSTIAYSTYTPILTYGTTPAVMYNYLKQSLIVASSSDNQFYPSLDPSEINDPNGRYTNSNLKIIYETKSIPLQKWNNIVIVYSSSIVDIFINGKIVKSNTFLTPIPSDQVFKSDITQINSLITGYTNGINGKICNIIYYNKKIGLEHIDHLYVSVKDNNPPIFYSSIL